MAMCAQAVFRAGPVEVWHSVILQITCSGGHVDPCGLFFVYISSVDNSDGMTWY